MHNVICCEQCVQFANDNIFMVVHNCVVEFQLLIKTIITAEGSYDFINQWRNGLRCFCAEDWETSRLPMGAFPDYLFIKKTQSGNLQQNIFSLGKRIHFISSVDIKISLFVLFLIKQTHIMKWICQILQPTSCLKQPHWSLLHHLEICCWA